ncbi:MAG: UvrD-helicase domain-containing protein [Opitutaceae bacterium]|jgi:ATP-dependent exoDNAse (exonuclease V) beta subunit|nr:UvrD-helicase domain-containing protein [Opitutaceae bacterium]
MSATSATDAQPLADLAARERFRDEWRKNFAVSANAGSGKTTAISERLAAMAMSADAAAMLPKTAVVTYTKKAAQQIGERARAVLLRRLSENKNGGAAGNGQAALNSLERAFFGTIHGFCLAMAKRHGQALGVNLNPEVISGSDTVHWEEFIEQDPMTFTALTGAQMHAFLRHMPLENIFGLAGSIGVTVEKELRSLALAGLPPGPDARVLDEILALRTRDGKPAEALRRNQQNAVEWARRFREETGFLPFIAPEGSAANIKYLYACFFGPVKTWLAEAGAALAAQLAERYRLWRFERGVQTFADQIETALSVLHNRTFLNKIRAEGWRIILDEAQDTDPMQFAVLVEMARPPGAELGTWPGAQKGGATGAPPRAGHFCMVGDGQQAIYGSRADVRNFTKHLDAFGRGDGGEKLEFSVTFRTPRRAISFFNNAFPHAFGDRNGFNKGIAPSEGAPEPLLQVPYQPLIPGPANAGGAACRFELRVPEDGAKRGVDAWMAEEARQLAEYFKARGPAGVGAEKWGDVCLLAPANSWLMTAGKVLGASGLKVSLQARKNRCGDNPVYAWMTGLLAVICDPDNAFEWFGVLREVFAVSDAQLAAEIRDPELEGMKKGGRNWLWQTPGEHPRPLRGALETLRPFVLKANDGGVPLGRFAEELARACGLEKKALLLAPGGEFADELHRLLADAATLGLDGASPRDWLRRLLDGIDDNRPAGKPERDAINLLTSHSSKGLEWDVVIPLGFWRSFERPVASGLQLVPDVPGIGPVVYFEPPVMPRKMRDALEWKSPLAPVVRGVVPGVYFKPSGMPQEMHDARTREALREQVRLMYVTLTRVKKQLIIPWGGDDFGKSGKGVSFADIFGRVDLIEALPVCGEAQAVPPARNGGGDGDGESDGGAVLREEDVEAKTAQATHAAQAVQTAQAGLSAPPSSSSSPSPLPSPSPSPLPPLPRRLLPHQLAHAPVDAVRAASHEATADDLPLARDDEAIDYGLWWHQTMELLPWTADEAALDAYFENAARGADAIGAGERGRTELARLRASDVLRDLREARWTRESELPVFAPANAEGGAWIDGIMDLVVHDAASGEARVVDWKTNRRRAGESDDALLARLSAEYAPQLRAYGRCVEMFFSGAHTRLFVVSSAAGKAVEIART